LCIKFTSSFVYIIRALCWLVSFFTTHIAWWYTNTLRHGVSNFTAIVASWLLRHNVQGLISSLKVYVRGDLIYIITYFQFYCVSKIEKLIHI
jgi:hypothetical protein